MQYSFDPPNFPLRIQKIVSTDCEKDNLTIEICCLGSLDNHLSEYITLYIYYADINNQQDHFIT